jgi:hypothetical protein
MNGGNPREDLIDHKDPEKAMALEQSSDWEQLSQNHLEGRTAGFFCYTDEGGNETSPDGRPKLLRHKHYFNPDEELFGESRDAYRPLVWQCRFSGVEVPDPLWSASRTGLGQPYNRNQAEDMVREDEIMTAFDAWTDRFAAFVAEKGKVEPGEHRAYGYEAPGHALADLKLKWCEWRMKADYPPAGSSPAKQQALGLNRDTGLSATASEGEKPQD